MGVGDGDTVVESSERDVPSDSDGNMIELDGEEAVGKIDPDLVTGIAELVEIERDFKLDAESSSGLHDGVKTVKPCPSVYGRWKGTLPVASRILLG